MERIGASFLSLTPTPTHTQTHTDEQIHAHGYMHTDTCTHTHTDTHTHIYTPVLYNFSFLVGVAIIIHFPYLGTKIDSVKRVKEFIPEIIEYLLCVLCHDTIRIFTLHQSLFLKRSPV